MTDILRLRNYRSYGDDGKSYVEYKALPNEVMVAILVGCEPKVVQDKKDFLDVEAIILEMAKNIKKAKQQEKKSGKV